MNRLFELERDGYPAVAPLFEELRYNLVVDSILAGNTRGQIVVDDLQAPRVALMWNEQDALLLAGDPSRADINRALAEHITTHIVPDARARYIPALSLHYTPRAWEEQVGVVLRDQHPRKALRRYHRLDHLKVDGAARLPSGWRMERMDAALLAETGRKNVGQVLGWITSFWRGVADFLESGFGFCLASDDVIASWCLSVYADQPRFELGVATDPQHRQLGFATLTAAACVDHCLAHQLVPEWHCDVENEPSVAVAGKVGFEPVGEYAVYRFELD
jgi:RimJ/RimL family protein N-acetyltransferase